MVAKPKTYPEKVAELQAQIQIRDDEIARLTTDSGRIQTLQSRIEELESELAARDKVTVQGVSGNKAQMVDLEARAVSAEGQLKNLNVRYQEAQRLIDVLNEQLDLAGADRDKNLGKQQKIDQLAEEIKALNNRIAGYNLQVDDIRREAAEAVANAEKQWNYYRQLADAQGKKLAAITEVVKNFPIDAFSDLKRLVSTY